MTTKQNKGKVITINTGEWMTQIEKAKERGCKPQYISELIRKGKLESWLIPELGLHLVKR